MSIPLGLTGSTTIRAVTEADRLAADHVREASAGVKGMLRGTAARPIFDHLIGETPAPSGVSFREETIGGCSGWWCEPEDAPADRAILHVHGGWFNWGSAAAFRHFAGHIALNAGVRTFVPDYRLAPEHVFPAAVVDVRACADALLARFGAVAVTGDSAGGNLALTLLAQRPQLAGAVVFSPITDLTQSSESWSSRADADPFFVRDQARELIASYLAGSDAADVLASPLFGALASLPAVRLHVGDDEVLLDDSLRYAERARATGADVRVDVWQHMFHGFAGSPGTLDAADRALRESGAFLNERLAASIEAGARA